MAVDTSELTMYLKLRDQIITGSNEVRDEFGVGLSFTKLTGWWDPPATTSTVTQRQYAHGAYGNKAYLTERNIVIEGEIFANDRVSLRRGLERLAASVPISDFEPFIVYEDGLTRHVMARQGGKTMIDWEGWMNRDTGQLESTFSIQLIAVDPRRLSGDGSAPTKFITTAPGTNNVSQTVVNDGLGIAPPTVIKFTGCTNPRLTVAGWPTPIWLEMTIPEGEVVSLDFDRKTVRMNGEDKYTALRGQFFDLDDRGNTFTFAPDAIAGTGQMIIETFDSDL